MKLALRILAIVFLLAQFVRPERTNPPVNPELVLQAHLDVPAQVDALLRVACYDCHSNETQWPWYASVAPASWLCVRDTNGGRRHLNFSEWGNYPASKVEHKLEEIAEYVESGEMPLNVYMPLHPEARLTEEERRVLVEWAGSAGGKGATAEGN
ncbi:hypothetical protein DRQ53_12940 [bacterium]|nr:MAG: hypothetical protein DRQ53_12940 [bacterium]